MHKQLIPAEVMRAEDAHETKDSFKNYASKNAHDRDA